MQKQYLAHAEHLEKSLNAKLEGLFLVMTLQFFLATLKVGQPFEMKYLRAYIRIIKQLTLFKPGCARLPSGLTFRSSRPAFGGRLSFFVSPLSNRFIQPMLFSPAFTFSSGYPLGVLPRAGLRLSWLCQFQAFLASSAYVASASSYLFASTAPLPWRSAFSRVALVVKLGFPVLASGSNSALKRTRILRAAYLGR